MTSYYTNLNGTGTNMFTKQALIDLAERVVRTFAAVFLTAVVAGVTSVSSVDTAAALGWSAAISAVTAAVGIIAAKIGNPDTASFVA